MDWKAELLAPAGSYDTMTAAFHAGADAVYIGGTAFGARAYADNPDEMMLLQAIRYAHMHGRRLYLTVNTLLKEEELCTKLYSYLRPYYEEGLDAVIVQDMGVLRFIREYFPELAVHASTQMTITGELSARHLEELGVRRVVTARELSLEEIRAIHDTCSIEIESFVHGALCYCYSGQCLFSSIAGGRSGNRGRCAQPCRLPYQLQDDSGILVPESRGYLLSPKDLNTIHRLPEILDAGVYSLKIEGRMKKPEYTAGVVSIYRKYLDRILEHGTADYRVLPEDDRKLFDLFNRSGFTDGYYFRRNGKQMITLARPRMRAENEALNDDLRRTFIESKLKENIKGTIKIFAGKPAIITLSCGDYSCRLEGEAVSTAQSRPLAEDDIRRCMEKIKDTDFAWESLRIETDGRSFCPVGKLNELRRRALELLEETMTAGFRRSAVPKWEAQPEESRGGTKQGIQQPAGEKQEMRQLKRSAEAAQEVQAAAKEIYWYACVETKEQLACVMRCGWIDRIYIDCHLAEGEELIRAAACVRETGKECFLVLPKIVRLRAKERMKQQLPFWKKAGFDGYLTSSAEGLFFLKEQLGGVRIAGDHSLYAFTRMAEAEWRDWGLEAVTAPAELNRAELRRRGLEGMELIVYGRLPMMISAQCLHQSSHGCIGRQQDLQLKDRMGNLFPVRNYCRECYNIIYNSKPLSLLDVWDQAKAMHPAAARLVFTTEDAEDTKAVLDLFERAAKGETFLTNPAGCTRGHWKRGVE